MPVSTPGAARAQRLQERGENFPVALRLLPSSVRTDLQAVYAFARTVDDIGDDDTASAADRVARLEALREDLSRIWHGRCPQDPVLRRLRPVVLTHQLAAEPFQALVEANLMDQQVTRYATFEDLLGYCRLSANPVGHIVLARFGALAPSTIALSDDVCSALQVLEHCQDVGEDLRRGRVYLPQDDLARFGVEDADLGRDRARPAVRALIRAETDRAARLLDSGERLLAQLHGWARVVVSGYIAGGQATVQALRRHDADVLARSVRPRPTDVALRSMALLTGPALRRDHSHDHQRVA